MSSHFKSSPHIGNSADKLRHPRSDAYLGNRSGVAELICTDTYIYHSND